MKSCFIITVLCAYLPATIAAERLELSQKASEARPIPQWVKIIDLAKSNPALKGYTAPQGVQVDIVAKAPAVINPVGMTFSEDGTPYVIEWKQDKNAKPATETIKFKDGSTRTVTVLKKSVKDVIKKLIDADGDGTYEKAEVVLEESLPSSLLFHNDWLYVASGTSVRRYKTSDLGSDKKPKAEVIVKGFHGMIPHHVSGISIGNDGWLYLSAGSGDHDVEGSDGSRVQVHRSGAIFRCRPDGSKVEVYSIGFCNPYRDVAFDNAFNLFQLDNDSEQNTKFTGCRLMHIAELADYGWRQKPDTKTKSHDPIRSAVFGELPGKMPPMIKTGNGSPAGLLIYNDAQFPEDYRGLLYYPDALRQSIRAYRVRPDGASFGVVNEFTFLKSDDPLFRPCQMVTGPDGAMYIVDWRTNSGGAGQFWGDGKHGRIYRITWKGTGDVEGIKPRSSDSWTRLKAMKEEELLEQLASESFTIRIRAQQELVRRGDKQRGALLKIFQDDVALTETRIAAFGALCAFWNEEVAKVCLEMVEDLDPDVRRLSVEALGRHQLAKGTNVIGLLMDSDLSVARTAALAIARTNIPGAADVLAHTLANDESNDLYFRDGLIRGLEIYGKTGISALISLAESGDTGQTIEAANAFLSLRIREGAKALPRMLTNPHVNDKSREKLFLSYTNYLLKPSVSLKPLFKLLANNIDQLKQVAALLMAKKLPSSWKPQIVPLLQKHKEKDDAVKKLLKDLLQ